MKRILATLLFLCGTLAAQMQTTPSNVVSVSGTVFNITNYFGAFNGSFEEVPSGSPATVSVTIQGCMKSGTCDSASDTNTSTSAAIRNVTFSKLYSYFQVTVSFTGGTNPTMTINPALSTARVPSAGITSAAVIAAFTGCSGVQYLGADGACHAAAGGVSTVFTRSGAVVATSGDYTVAQVTGAAPLASPTFTGTPAAPTAAINTNTTQVATTAYVVTGFAPIASPTFTGTVTIPGGASISGFAPLASPALTGTPTAPTASALTNTTQIATTAYGDAAVAVETSRATTAEALKAPLASPALTGTPTVPTAAVDTNTTQAASTAYVIGEGYVKNTVTVNTHALSSNVVVSASDVTTGTLPTAQGGSGITATTPLTCYISTSATAAGAGDALSGTANRATSYAFNLPFPCATSKVVYSLGTADNTANTYDIGIYSCTAPCPSSTGTLVAHIGSTAGTVFAAATGVHASIAWTGGTVTLQPGRFYFLVTSSCVATCAKLNSGSSNVLSASTNQVVTVTAGGTLPATVTLPADSPVANANPPALIIE